MRLLCRHRLDHSFELIPHEFRILPPCSASALSHDLASGPRKDVSAGTSDEPHSKSHQRKYNKLSCAF
jgi:hypothetical protein